MEEKYNISIDNLGFEILPCPFCGWKKIRIIEDEGKEPPHKGSKFTFCWCKVCGTRGPWAYNVDLEDMEVVVSCIERWNERSIKD